MAKYKGPDAVKKLMICSSLNHHQLGSAYIGDAIFHWGLGWVVNIRLQGRQHAQTRQCQYRPVSLVGLPNPFTPAMQRAFSPNQGSPPIHPWAWVSPYWHQASSLSYHVLSADSSLQTRE